MNFKYFYLLGFLFLALTIPAVKSNKGYATLIGQIVDNEGNAVSSTQIKVYESYFGSVQGAIPGLYINTIEVQKDGSFALNITSPRLILLISAPGYQTQQLTFSETNFLEIYDLGKIHLESGIIVSLSDSSRSISQGESLDIQFQIENKGNSDEVVKLQYQVPDGITIKLKDQSGEISSLKLPPNSAQTLTMKLSSSILTPVGSYNCSLQIQGEYKTANILTMVYVKSTEIEIISSELNTKIGNPGTVIRFETTVNNPFDSTKTLFLSIDGLTNGWNANLLSTSGDKIDRITLSADMSTKIYVDVEIPLGAEPEENSFLLKATVDEVTQSQNFTIKVEKADTVIELKTLYPSQTVEIGKITIFKVSLTNPSNIEEIVNLTAEDLPENWILRFLNTDGVEIQQILLSSQATQNLSVEVTPSLTSEPNDYSLKVLLKGQILSGELPLEISLEGTHELTVSVSSLYEELTVGETNTIEVRVTNTGYSSLTDVALQLTASSSDIGLDTQPIKETLIKPNEYKTFTITVSTPQGIATGDYALNVAATARELASATGTKTIRLTLVSSSNITLIAGGLVVVSLIGVALLLRRFKRR